MAEEEPPEREAEEAPATDEEEMPGTDEEEAPDTDAEENPDTGAEEEEEAEVVPTKKQFLKGTKNKIIDKCGNNHILDELATPPKRMFLALYNDHGHHLPKEKVKNLKLLLQRLYAMTPEETAQYFSEIRAEAKAAAARKKLKQKLRKYLESKNREKQTQRAYVLFKKILKCGMSYAAQNPIPAVISIRLRYLSDIILEQLCTLRGLDMPDRAKSSKQGQFLISVADWMAIALERLYFSAQTTIQQLTNENQAGDETTAAPGSYQEMGAPLASSTPQRHSLDQSDPAAYSAPKRHSVNQTVPSHSQMGKPLASSTPERRSLSSQNQTVPRTYDEMGHPLASSTPERLSLQRTNTMEVPSTYSGFGQPDANSTPQNIELFPDYTLLEVEEFYQRIIHKVPESPARNSKTGGGKRATQAYHYAKSPMLPCRPSGKSDRSGMSVANKNPYADKPAAKPSVRKRRKCESLRDETLQLFKDRTS